MTITEKLEIYGPATCPVCGEYTRTFVRNHTIGDLVCIFCDLKEKAEELDACRR